MDRQLQSPPLILTIDKPKRVKYDSAYSTLDQFISQLPYSPARTQLERLTDAIGVETGHIQPSEGEAREQKRKEAKLAAKAEKRRLRELAQREAEKQDLEAEVEGLEDDEEMDQGAVGFEGEEGMDDRGDVEYGDVERDEDEDEPDNADEAGETDDKMDEDW